MISRRFFVRAISAWAGGCAAILAATADLQAYEVTLHGGPRMDIPESWFLDDSDPAVPSWYSRDRRAAADVLLWAPGTWNSLDEFLEEVRPEGAEGEVVRFSHWEGEAALADWSFATGGNRLRGWFLVTAGSGPDVRISAIAAEEDYEAVKPFLLSVIDSYSPSDRWSLSPGAVGRFLELSGEPSGQTAESDFHGTTLSWRDPSAGTAASQDLIEREALILATYAREPELFYEAWRRYYRLIFRDSYSRLAPLAEALKAGPIPPGRYSDRKTAELVLDWLQGFSYGSTDGFSDLLAPSAACAAGSGDCDSLALALLILMHGYGVEGRIVITHSASHAVAALDLPGNGTRFADSENSWLVAELTANLPLGTLPEKLDKTSDWFSINPSGEDQY